MNDKIIILVEDNADDEFLALRTLKRNQLHNVVVVRDGAEAIDTLLGKEPVKPWFVLLDLKLPKVDGVEVLETIRADERTRDIPVAVISSSMEKAEQDRCAMHGVSLYVDKPLDSEKLTAILKVVQEK